MVKLREWFHKKWYRKSLKKAIRHAIHVKSTTSLKCLVLFVPGGYKAYTKQAVKLLHRQKYFKKGVSLSQIESMAVYSTN